MRTALIGCLAAGVMWAGTQPKTAAKDYPVRARLKGAAIAAEYHYRALPIEGGAVTPNSLVVEVAVFPDEGKPIEVRTEHFRLRVNAEPYGSGPQSPAAVAGEMKAPKYANRTGVEMGGGVGDAGVMVGRPPPVERFPGDPRARRGPSAPRAPEDASLPSKTEKKADWQWVEELALDEGPHERAASGLLYFLFEKSAKKIKSLSLDYDGPAGRTSLKLM